jgi:hypothetical protein
LLAKYLCFLSVMYCAVHICVECKEREEEHNKNKNKYNKNKS